MGERNKPSVLYTNLTTTSKGTTVQRFFDLHDSRSCPSENGCQENRTLEQSTWHSIPLCCSSCNCILHAGCIRLLLSIAHDRHVPPVPLDLVRPLWFPVLIHRPPSRKRYSATVSTAAIVGGRKQQRSASLPNTFLVRGDFITLLKIYVAFCQHTDTLPGTFTLVQLFGRFIHCVFLRALRFCSRVRGRE